MDKKENREIYLILPNIRSLHNVGSVFRIADCIGATKIFLCGWTGTPPAPGLVKVALGAEKTIPWEQASQAWRVVDRLKKDGVQIIGLEYTEESVDYRELDIQYPCALILGNEVKGVSKTLLKRCDAVMHLPMVGLKESLNVSVACGIAAYHLRFGN
jgi:tRNA G18 (ribose-2'-O)-methylase SpoU